MKKADFSRREIIRMLGYGGVGGAIAMEQLAGVPGLLTMASNYLPGLGKHINPYDSYALMGDVLRGGRSVFAVHQAMAQNDDNQWTLVQIKVCNHVYTPLVFKLGKLTGTTVTSAADVQLASAKMTTAKTTLEGRGVNLISDIPRYRDLRFNKWFADMLHNGTANGLAPVEGNLLGLKTTDVNTINADKVAIQAFLGLDQIESNNHALKGCKLRSNLPDLTLYAQQNKLVASPLGITCMMMGKNYDKAEGAVNTNVVLGAETAETAVVSGRTVNEYVSQIQQFVGKSYADRSGIEQSVTYKIDQLVDDKPILRRELINSIGKFKQGIDSLKSAALIETKFQVMNLAEGNTQSLGPRQGGASSEFVAQCKYVANSLDLPGLPVRNFSLFLNISDLDGQNLDVGFNGGGGGDVRAFSYVEGMRQLAMGLNVLAKKIAADKRVIVVVTSEGGRGSQMQDSKASFALVMGPKGPGLLEDKLFCNNAAIDADSNNVIKDMAAPGSVLAWDTDGLMEKDGTKSTAKPNAGDVQMGVVDFLEQVSGVQVRKDLPSTDGRFVKLQRKA
jgi:hypothetical protein